MSADMKSNSGRYLITALIPILIILFPLGYGVAGYFAADDIDDVRPFLEKPDAQYKNCVEETEYMRYHHWELLREIRKEVVRYGRRGDVDLDNCKDCHTSRERFCMKCHNAAGVIPDCYGCHYYP